MYYGSVCSSLRICMKRNISTSNELRQQQQQQQQHNTTNKKNSIEYEKQKVHFNSSICQAFNHPNVHMLNHTEKVNDNHIKMKKNVSLSLSLSVTKELHCSGLL